MMERGIIYCVTCLNNGKPYFGQTVRPIKARWRQHVVSANNGSDHKFHRAIRKYGLKNFAIEEVISVEASSLQALKAKLDFLERHFIQKYDTRRNGYNTTDGGEGTLGASWKVSEEGRRNMSLARKGYHPSKESIRKSAESRRGKCYLTEEGRKRISKAHLGKKASVEVRLKMSLARKGRKFSETHKLNLSKSKLGEKNPFYGKHHSKEFRHERSKRVIEISDSGEILMSFDSIGNAKEFLGICRKSLCKLIKSGKLTNGKRYKIV